ncbi:hypothetical protein ACQUWZ_27520 [Ralstonia pseudosolanacearum]|uniref:hypothetical protein n=1 Tax=Ralstonia pseudosolanacearum TaxID=1310165 RepID=UPI003D16BB8E
MSKIEKAMAQTMLSIAAASGMADPVYTPDFSPFPRSNHWKEPKEKDGKPKTKVEYYIDDKGNIRRRKIKL